MQHSPGTTNAGNRPKAAGADKQPLQIRIPGDIKRRFKAHAAIRGMDPNQLFVEVWEHYERSRAAGLDESLGAGDA